MGCVDGKARDDSTAIASSYNLCVCVCCVYAVGRMGEGFLLRIEAELGKRDDGLVMKGLGVVSAMCEPCMHCMV